MAGGCGAGSGEASLASAAGISTTKPGRSLRACSPDRCVNSADAPGISNLPVRKTTNSASHDPSGSRTGGLTVLSRYRNPTASTRVSTQSSATSAFTLTLKGMPSSDVAGGGSAHEEGGPATTSATADAPDPAPEPLPDPSAATPGAARSSRTSATQMPESLPISGASSGGGRGRSAAGCRPAAPAPGSPAGPSGRQ